jgi:hypothetical protein
MVSAVVGIAVLSAAGGYGVGELTQPKSVRLIDTGPIAAASTTAGPSASSPTPATTRTPVPNNEPSLDPDDVRFDSKTFTVVSEPGATVPVKAEFTGDVPQHWKKVTLNDHPDWGKFTAAYSKRTMRYGLPIADTIDGAKELQVARLSPLHDQLITFQSEAQSGSTVGDDETQRTYSAIAYTYLPPGENRSLLYVITRWVSLHTDGKADVEISVAGLPQDRAALEKVMDRAVKSVTRQDG